LQRISAFERIFWQRRHPCHSHHFSTVRFFDLDQSVKTQGRVQRGLFFFARGAAHQGIRHAGHDGCVVLRQLTSKLRQRTASSHCSQLTCSDLPEKARRRLQHQRQ
jgi:hypothetical protein